MTETRDTGMATRAIHAHGGSDPHGSPHVPIYNTTTFAFDSTADLLDVVEGQRPGPLYTRYGANPTVSALERTLASLEGGESARAFASGMGAIAALFFAHGRDGVADAMARHPAIARSLYPGLPDFPGHELAARQMSGFGGIVTIEVDGDGAAAAGVADRLRLLRLAPSLGGAESLVTQPRTTTHHDLSDAERARRGITDGMLRLSIGLEDAPDLVADLEQGLA